MIQIYHLDKRIWKTATIIPTEIRIVISSQTTTSQSTQFSTEYSL